MFNKFPALRRVGLYVIFSYLALVLVNNSGLSFDNMWVIYTPMFIGIYVFSRWLDSRLGSNSADSSAAAVNTVDNKGGFG